MTILSLARLRAWISRSLRHNASLGLARAAATSDSQLMAAPPGLPVRRPAAAAWSLCQQTVRARYGVRQTRPSATRAIMVRLGRHPAAFRPARESDPTASFPGGSMHTLVVGSM